MDVLGGFKRFQKNFPGYISGSGGLKTFQEIPRRYRILQGVLVDLTFQGVSGTFREVSGGIRRFSETLYGLSRTFQWCFRKSQKVSHISREILVISRTSQGALRGLRGILKGIVWNSRRVSGGFKAFQKVSRSYRELGDIRGRFSCGLQSYYLQTPPKMPLNGDSNFLLTFVEILY